MSLVLPLWEPMYVCDLKHKYVELYFYQPTPRTWRLLAPIFQNIVEQAIRDTGFINSSNGVDRVMEKYHQILDYEAPSDILREVTNLGGEVTLLLEELIRETFRHVNNLFSCEDNKYLQIEVKESRNPLYLYTGVIVFDPTI